MTKKKDLLELLKKIKNFNEFEKELSKETNETRKGDLFELFCKAYLEVIHPQEFKSVTLFKNTKPSILDKLNLKITKDYGIDLIAITNADEIWTIQSKFRQSNHVTWRELSTFRSSSEKAGFMLVMGNLNQILHPHQILSRFSSVLRYDFERLDENDFSKIRNYLGTKEKVNVFTPRPHQKRAMKNAIEHFGKSDQGQMIHACGTGKTLTSLWIKEELKPEATIIYLPSLALLKQTLEQWSKHKKENFNIKCVCSDTSVVKETDETEVDIQELGVPVTTDEKEIVKFLRFKGPKVVFSTYQSAPVILEAIRPINFKFDFGVFDEAHRTASKSNRLFTKCLKTPIKKSLFMTATPKLYAPGLRKRAEEEEILLCSMDDESIYGKVFDEIKFGEAIQLGLLSDYKIKIITVNDEKIKELIDRRYWLDLLGKELTADELAKAWALTESMKIVNHVISFHSNIKGANDFQKNINHVINYLNNKGRKIKEIKSYHISGKFPAFLRSEILKEFIQDKKSLVTNARCLTEGVDVPAIDGVYFVDPKRNIIDIVQATGRAIRKKESKYGYVIIPVYIKDEQEVDGIISSTAFEQVWKVIEAMKDQDERLQHIITELKILEGKKKFGSLKSRELSEQRRLRNDLANVLDFDDSILPKNIDIKDFVEKVGVKTIEVIGGNWDNWFGEYISYTNINNREPNSKSSLSSEAKLANWVHRQRQFYKKGIKITKERIEKLNSIGFIWDTKEDNWEKSFNDYVNLKNKMKREPVETSSDLKEQSIARWVTSQRTSYNRKELTLERKNRLKKINFVFNKMDFKWNDALSRYSLYVEDNKREPSNHSKDPEEKFLGIWAGRQRRLLAESKLEPERKAILDRIGFPWVLKKDAWNQKFTLYCNFIKKNKRHPFDSSKRGKNEVALARWANKQRDDKKKKRLSEDRIEKLNSINFEWVIVRKKWPAALENYVSCKKKINKEPSTSSKLKSERSAAHWAGLQRKNYKKGKLSQERIDKLNSIGFEWKKKK